MPSITDNSQILATSSITIASGQTTSGALNLHGNIICAIIAPIMTGTSLTFSVSFDGTTYYDYYDQYNSQPSIVVSSAARYIEIDEEDFVGAQYVKLISNATEAAQRSFSIITRPL